MYEQRYCIRIMLAKAENFDYYIDNCTSNEDNVLISDFVFLSVYRFVNKK